MPLSAAQRRSLKSFDADLVSFAKTLDINLEKVIKKISFDIFGKVVRKTPVDTGRCRSSWNISAGKVDQSVTHKSVVYPQARSATQAAMSKLEGFDLPDTYSLVYITNNLPYAKALEDGHSAKAPRGMVRVTIVEVAAEMERSIKEVLR